MHDLPVEAVLVVAGVAAIALSPFGRETLRSVRDGGLTFQHARHLGHVMTAVCLLIVLGAVLSVH